MKNISTLLLSFLLSFNALASYGPTSIKGQQDASASAVTGLQFPNKQVTNRGNKTFYVETGNNNLLANASFEEYNSTGAWTLSPATTAEISDVQDGKISLTFTPAAQALEISQDSTINAAGFTGTNDQGIASARIKVSAVTDQVIQMCPRRAGVIVSDLCQTVVANGEWGTYEAPFELGSTSNGISVHSIGYANVTGTIQVDKMYVGLASLRQGTDNSKYVGSLVYPVTGACNWTNTATSYSNFPVDTDCPTGVADGVVGNPSTKVPAFTLPDGSAAGTYLVLVKGFVYHSGVAVRGSVRLSDGSSSTNEATIHGGSANSTLGSSSFTYKKLTTSAVTVHLQSEVSANSMVVDAQSEVVSFEVFYFPNRGSIYSTMSADTGAIGEIKWLPTATAPNGFIPVTNKTIGKSGANYNGDSYRALFDILWAMDGLSTTAGHPFKISSAKGASAQADWDALKTIAIDFETNGLFIRQKKSARTLGSYEASDNLSHNHTLKVSNQSGNSYTSATGYLSHTSGGHANFHTATDATNTVMVNLSGNVTEARPNNVSMHGFIRYAPKMDVAILNLSGLEQCTDSYECTDTFSAKITAAGVVSGENLDWINGNCSVATSTFTCPIKTGLNGNGVSLSNELNCTFTADQFGAYDVTIGGSSSSTNLIYVTYNSAAGAQASDVNVTCQKSGSDYIGKTAMAVASDQNVRSIGSVGVDIQSVYFGSGANCSSVCSTSPCTICRQVGSKITSVTRNSIGTYFINGIDGTKYTCSGNSYGASAPQGVIQDFSNSTSTYAYVQSYNGGTAADSKLNALTCIGVP